MKTSPAGIADIRDFEGCVLKAYQDVVGVWTIGIGHTGSDVHPEDIWTQQKADETLAKDLLRFEMAVDKAVNVQISQGQFDAMVSLAFNIGEHAFRTSTLVKKLNAGNVRGAACQFAVWHKAGGKLNAGLLLRRAAELWTFARASQGK